MLSPSRAQLTIDESTAVVEGMLVARRASKAKTDVFLVDVDALYTRPSS